MNLKIKSLLIISLLFFLSLGVSRVNFAILSQAPQSHLEISRTAFVRSSGSFTFESPDILVNPGANAKQSFSLLAYDPLQEGSLLVHSGDTVSISLQLVAEGIFWTHVNLKELVFATPDRYPDLVPGVQVVLGQHSLYRGNIDSRSDGFIHHEEFRIGTLGLGNQTVANSRGIAMQMEVINGDTFSFIISGTITYTVYRYDLPDLSAVTNTSIGVQLDGLPLPALPLVPDHSNFFQEELAARYQLSLPSAWMSRSARWVEFLVEYNTSSMQDELKLEFEGNSQTIDRDNLHGINRVVFNTTGEYTQSSAISLSDPTSIRFSSDGAAVVSIIGMSIFYVDAISTMEIVRQMNLGPLSVYLLIFCYGLFIYFNRRYVFVEVLFSRIL